MNPVNLPGISTRFQQVMSLRDEVIVIDDQMLQASVKTVVFFLHDV